MPVRQGIPNAVGEGDADYPPEMRMPITRQTGKYGLSSERKMLLDEMIPGENILCFSNRALPYCRQCKVWYNVQYIQLYIQYVNIMTGKSYRSSLERIVRGKLFCMSIHKKA